MDLSPFTLPSLHISLFLLLFQPFISHPKLPVATFSASSKFCLLFSSILSLLIYWLWLTFPPYVSPVCSGTICPFFTPFGVKYDWQSLPVMGIGSQGWVFLFISFQTILTFCQYLNSFTPTVPPKQWDCLLLCWLLHWLLHIHLRLRNDWDFPNPTWEISLLAIHTVIKQYTSTEGVKLVHFLNAMSSLCWRNIFKDNCQPISQFLPFLWELCLRSACPLHPQQREAFLSVLARHPRCHRPSPICLSALRPLSWGCALSLPPPPSLTASLSLMRRDRYGRGGRRRTCLSKPPVENEGSDEGGMLCILNAQTPVRTGGRCGGVGIYQ